MPDTMPYEVMAQSETRHEALEILEAFMTETKGRDENAALMAGAWFFDIMCEELDVDPIDTLCQMLDIERPEMQDE